VTGIMALPSGPSSEPSCVSQGDELAPIRNGRKRVADDAIHPGRDGGVGADAETDQEHDGQREPWIGGEATNRMAKISPD
jgi:hypothetical protein